MSHLAATAEMVLCSAYVEEAELYARAVGIAEGLPSAYQQGDGADEKLQPILVLLDEIAAIEARIAETKRLWRASGQRAGPQLQAALARVTEMIERLTDRVQVAEREASAQKDRLSPELDAAVRGRKMQRAYGVVMIPPTTRSLDRNGQGG